MNFKGRDVISIKDFSKEEINYILNYTKKMVSYAKDHFSKIQFLA